MIRFRRYLALLLVLASAIAASSANAATVTVPASAITATSLGLVSFIKGATAMAFAARFTGAVRAGTYTGTLGVTLFPAIASLTGGTCTASTPAGITTACLFGTPWTIGATFNGNIATWLITNFQWLTTFLGGACLETYALRATYDRTTGLLTITTLTAISQVALAGGTCPAGTPSMRGSFAISPRLTWSLA